MVNTKLKTAVQAADLELSNISIQIGGTSIVSKRTILADDGNGSLAFKFS